jgi:prepilin-type N-terminal cleavage/methylation domain-containing protein
LRRAKAGYSLPELLLVLVIVGVVTAISIPAFGQLMPYFRLRAAATQMDAAIRVARQKAITTRRAHRISLDVTNNRYALYCVNAPNASMATPSNWIAVDRFGRPTPSGDPQWIPLPVDLQSSSVKPFFDVDGDGNQELVFKRDALVATTPASGTTTALTFTPPPEIVLVVSGGLVPYNTIRFQLLEQGALNVVKEKN